MSKTNLAFPWLIAKLLLSGEVGPSPGAEVREEVHRITTEAGSEVAVQVSCQVEVEISVVGLQEGVGEIGTKFVNVGSIC
jgi:hypothetical protein